MNTEREPPIFDKWSELFVDGLNIVIISLGYLLVPMVIGGGLFVAAILELSVGSEVTTTLGSIGLVLALLVGGGLTLLHVALGIVAMEAPTPIRTDADTAPLSTAIDRETSFLSSHPLDTILYTLLDT